MNNLKIGDNITPEKHFTKFFPPLPLNNVEVQKLYKISEMCWTLDSQHCLGGRGSRYYWRVNKNVNTFLPRLLSLTFYYFSLYHI